MLGVGVVPIISLIGAIQMLRGKSYAWSMTGTIAGMLPCSACCVLGLVFGIWALVVLNQPDVKQAFS
jgi:presenilin-like A22 family membrane protease